MEFTGIMNEKQAAKYVGLSAGTLQNYRCQLKGPVFIKIGKSVRYMREDLDEYLKANRVEPIR